jgi:hypothetical protein
MSGSRRFKTSIPGCLAVDRLPFRLRAGLVIGIFLVGLTAPPATAAIGIATVWRQTHWGETDGELLRQFGVRASRLPRPLDFGDSYADVVLRRETLGGVAVIVYFQMDRRRHGVNPPALRAILAALQAAYGTPDRRCLMPPRALNGFQAAAIWAWLRDGAQIRAIFRDTTIEAVEGCLGGQPLPCGLTGQLLVRISPAGFISDACADPAR